MFNHNIDRDFNNKNDVSIIIVNWNTADLLKACLESTLKEAGYLNIQIIVVDNASADNSVDLVKKEFPDVKLITNTHNVGFAVANNQALPLCEGEYILLLNSDTKLTTNCLTGMVEFMRKNLKAGACGPRILEIRRKARVLSAGYQPTLRTVFNHYFGISPLFPKKKFFRGIHLFENWLDKDNAVEVEWLTGACLLIRSEVIKKVGKLNERWFMYAEDWELCDRILKSGWKLFFLPYLFVEHYGGASVEKNKSVNTLWIKNLVDYYKLRNKPGFLENITFKIIFSLGFLARGLVFDLKAILNKRNRENFKTEARNFRAYAKAVFEKRGDLKNAYRH